MATPKQGKFIGGKEREGEGEGGGRKGRGKEREGEGEEEKWRGGQTIKRRGEVRWALEMTL